MTIAPDVKLQVINLRNEGYTYAAISEITGVAVHNVSNYCKRAGARSGYGHLGRKKTDNPYRMGWVRTTYLTRNKLR